MITHFGMARVDSAQGDFDNAMKEAKSPLVGAPDDGTKPFLEAQIKRLEAKEDINKYAMRSSRRCRQVAHRV